MTELAGGSGRDGRRDRGRKEKRRSGREREKQGCSGRGEVITEHEAGRMRI